MTPSPSDLQALLEHGRNWYQATPERALADVELYVLSRRSELTDSQIETVSEIRSHLQALTAGRPPQPSSLAEAERREALLPLMADVVAWPPVARMVLWYGHNLLS